VQGKAGEVQGKLRQDLKPTLIANWKVWVPFQFINFRFVPQSLQARPHSAPLCRRSAPAAPIIKLGVSRGTPKLRVIPRS